MLPREIQADFASVDRMLRLARELPHEVSGEIQSMICQHICIVVAGRLEQGLKEIVRQHVRVRSSSSLDRAIVRLCQGFQNPKPEKIVELVDLFDRDASRRLLDDWKNDDEPTSGNLSALISKRINIAHQKNRHENVSIEMAAQFVDVYKRIVTRISNELKV